MRWVWVPGRLARDWSVTVTDAAGGVVRVSGPVGCLDGSAAVLGRAVEALLGGLVRVRFARGVEAVVRVESPHAWDDAAGLSPAA